MKVFLELANSKAKTRILSTLFSRPHLFSVSELARLSDLSKATVSNIVQQWEKTGLVLCRVQGKNKLVSINPKFYLLPELKRVFEKTKNFQKPLLQKLEIMPVLKNRFVKAVVVFGSRLGNEFSHSSDLDVLVAIEDNENPIAEKITEAFVKATEQTGIRFSPVLMDKKDIRTRWKEKDQFIQNILNKGKILKGGKWIEHVQATA